MTGDTTEQSRYSPWMVASRAMLSDSGPVQKASAGSADVSAAKLSAAEKRALMACYMIGRRHGLVAKFGPLGQLTQRWDPQGAIAHLAEAYIEIGEGRLDVAAARLKGLPLRKPGDASQRDEAVAKLQAFARLMPKKLSV